MKNLNILAQTNAVRMNSANQQTNKLLVQAVAVGLLTGLVGFAPTAVAATAAQQSEILRQVVAPLVQKVQQGTITQEDIKVAKARAAAIAPQRYCSSPTSSPCPWATNCKHHGDSS